MRGLFYILFPLAMAGIARLFPYKKPENYTPPNAASMEKIMRWGKISGWYYLAVVILLFYLIGIQMPSGKQHFIPHNDGVVYTVLPDGFYWFLVGFVPVIGLSSFIFIFISKLYLGDDFHGYVDVSNSKSKYDAYKILQPMAALFAAVGLTLLFCLWNYSIYIYPDKMVVHWFLGTESKTYSYSQVKSVNFIKENRKLKYGAHCDIVFKDGQDWNTSTGLPDDAKDGMIKYISKQSGIKIDTLNEDPQ